MRIRFTSSEKTCNSEPSFQLRNKVEKKRRGGLSSPPGSILFEISMSNLVLTVTSNDTDTRHHALQSIILMCLSEAKLEIIEIFQKRKLDYL